MSSEESTTKKELIVEESKETAQEKLLLERINKKLISKAENLEQAKSELEKKLFEEKHATKEIEQERLFLNSINRQLKEQLSTSNSSVSKSSNTKEQSSSNQYDKINSLLDIYKQITISRLTEYTKLDSDTVLQYLQQLESENKVTKLQDRKEITCSECSSVNIDPSFHCPSCNSSNYRQANLIEHYGCGNFSLEETYVDDKCPGCRKTIKALGVDYALQRNYFLCNECDNKFPDPVTSFQCHNCKYKFGMDKAKWNTSTVFQKNN